MPSKARKRRNGKRRMPTAAEEEDTRFKLDVSVKESQVEDFQEVVDEMVVQVGVHRGR